MAEPNTIVKRKRSSSPNTVVGGSKRRRWNLLPGESTRSYAGARPELHISTDDHGQRIVNIFFMLYNIIGKIRYNIDDKSEYEDQLDEEEIRNFSIILKEFYEDIEKITNKKLINVFKKLQKQNLCTENETIPYHKEFTNQVLISYLQEASIKQKQKLIEGLQKYKEYFCLCEAKVLLFVYNKNCKKFQHRVKEIEELLCSLEKDYRDCDEFMEEQRRKLDDLQGEFDNLQKEFDKLKSEPDHRLVESLGDLIGCVVKIKNDCKHEINRLKLRQERLSQPILSHEELGRRKHESTLLGCFTEEQRAKIDAPKLLRDLREQYPCSIQKTKDLLIGGNEKIAVQQVKSLILQSKIPLQVGELEFAKTAPSENTSLLSVSGA